MVEITTYGVVMAEDEAHAYHVADSYKREIFGDDWSPRIEVAGAVVEVADLAHGWDGECIPYGGDGCTMLGELMAPNVEVTGPARHFAQVRWTAGLGGSLAAKNSSICFNCKCVDCQCFDR
jgi:hypothetical protein